MERRTKLGATVDDLVHVVCDDPSNAHTVSCAIAAPQESVLRGSPAS